MTRNTEYEFEIDHKGRVLCVQVDVSYEYDDSENPVVENLDAITVLDEANVELPEPLDEELVKAITGRVEDFLEHDDNLVSLEEMREGEAACHADDARKERSLW